MTHRQDSRTFPKTMPYQHHNCCVRIRKECPTNISMLLGHWVTILKDFSKHFDIIIEVFGESVIILHCQTSKAR